MNLSLGMDVGTTGVRCAVVDADGLIVATARVAAPPVRRPDGTVDAADWTRAAAAALDAQAAALREAGRDMRDIGRLAVAGTSGSMTLLGADGTPVAPGLLYDSAGFDVEAGALTRLAIDASGPAVATGPGSAPARALRLLALAWAQPAHLAHQADMVATMLTGVPGVSDEGNALKTGHDPATGAWPGWFAGHPGLGPLLPRVLPLAAPMGSVCAAAAARFGLSRAAIVHAGATDSVAAFLAAAPAASEGTAVTSLGTTLAIKLVSRARIEDPVRGVYSHRLGDLWLAGGASNTGGGVLRAFFDDAEVARLTARIDPARPSGLDYYPLLRPGERFPVADPGRAPVLTPRPEDPAQFLQAMLEGMARIEAEGYATLHVLGAPRPSRILTAGGGATNPAWTTIRARALDCPVEPAAEGEGSVGLARWVAAA